MANSTLKNIYLGAGESEVNEVIALPVNDALAKAVRAFSISCVPMAKLPSSLPIWFRRFAPLGIYSFDYALYEKQSASDLEQTRQLINQVAGDSSPLWPIELKAFVIHNLLAYVVGYRSPTSLICENSPFVLPVWRGGTLHLEPCRCAGDINLLGGVCARVFVPITGSGTPTYLFHGTLCWNCANGAGVTIVDDFNPIGVGAAIHASARRRLKQRLKDSKVQHGEGVVAIGQSLGGIIATTLGIQLEESVDRVIAFGPPKPPLSLKTAVPNIFTFFGCFGGAVDPIIKTGERWVGRVFEVQHASKEDPIARHIIPLGIALDYTICEIKNHPPTPVWNVLQRIGATAVFCVLLPLLLVKRLFFGWATGGLWRWGLFGVPFQLWR